MLFFNLQLRIGQPHVYGNITQCVNLAEGKRWPPDLPVEEERLAKAPREPDGSVIDIEAAQVAERILATVRTACNFYADAGFFGLVTVRFLARRIQNVPLVWNPHGSELRRTALGMCPLSAEIVLEEQMETSSLAEDYMDVLSPLVRRMLWAWGSMDEHLPERIIDKAEQLHFGRVQCEPPSCKQWKATTRDRCMNCRKKG